MLMKLNRLNIISSSIYTCIRIQKNKPPMKNYNCIVILRAVQIIRISHTTSKFLLFVP